MSFFTQVMKSIETLRSMMLDRNATEIYQELMELSPEKLEDTLASKHTFMVDARPSRILYALSSKFKLADVKKFIEDDDFTYVMIVTKEKLSSINQRAISEIKKNVQVFELRELQFNITKHTLVPKHELITDETEIHELIKIHNLKARTQLPFILKTDPVARYYNAKTGNVMRITRWSPTSGEHIVYRCCV